MRSQPLAPLCHLLFLAGVVAFLGIHPVNAAETQQAITVRSPNKQLSATIGVDHTGAVRFSVQRAGQAVIEPSPIGIVINGADLGNRVRLGKPKLRRIREAYATRGLHSMASNDCREALIPAESLEAGAAYTIELRVFNDGVGYRYRVPGAGERTVNGETSSWTLPSGAEVWYSERDSAWKLKTYAGEWLRAPVEQMPTVSKQGPVQCPPLVAEIDHAFVLLTEAAVFNYSGMRLRATGNRRFQADFTEGTNGFRLAGEIVTPWRVTLVANDLNALVNSDVLTSLCPPPDQRLFGDTKWIRPGRAAWRWWSSGTGTYEEERAVVDAAAELGFEYTIVDDGWEKWPDCWERLRELCSYARRRNVGVFVWKHYEQVASEEGNRSGLRNFLTGVAEAGAAGVKLDFLNSESLTHVRFEEAVLKLAAERKLLVNFHGCRKPGGEARTYPNEMTREAVRGLELNRMKEGPISASHNAALPFTRFVAGHADYTPLGFSNPGGTSFAHQLATTVAFTSPLQVIAENPHELLENPLYRPALGAVKEIPAAWDETCVLEPSAIGELALIARRSGKTWYLAALNGSKQPRKLSLDGLPFLGRGSWSARYFSSPSPKLLSQRAETGINKRTKLVMDLAPADGFVAIFESER